MRIKFTNQSSRDRHVLRALAEFAASFFGHVTGIVPVIIKNTRAGRGSHGRCYGHRRCVIWLKPDDAAFPKAFEQMHYFRHANHDSVKPLEVKTWLEHALSIIAHEMEHTTPGNKRMRRSRQEIHAWNRSVEVVEAFRLQASADAHFARVNELRYADVHRKMKTEQKHSAVAKLLRCEELQAKWQRKLKLAQTKIKKLKLRIKYYEKKRAASGSGEVFSRDSHG